MPTKTTLQKHMLQMETDSHGNKRERNKNHLSNSGVDVEPLKTEALEIELHITNSLHEMLIVIRAERATAAREERHGNGRQVPDGDVHEGVGRRRRVVAHEKELEELRGLGILHNQRNAHLPRGSTREGHRLAREGQTKAERHKGRDASFKAVVDGGMVLQQHRRERRRES